MKKLILTAAAAMMVLASCTKTKVESIDGPKEIAFKKIEGAMTKAVTEDLAGNTTMGVYAIKHGATTDVDASYYFKNISYGPNTQSGPTAWVATPPQYWPLSDALDFVVYAPHHASNSSYDQSTKTISYTITSNPQTDYMYGKQYYDDDGDYTSGDPGDGYTKQSTNIPVELIHALTKITVNIKLGDGATEGSIKVKSLVLAGTKQDGTIKYNYSTKAQTNESATESNAYDLDFITGSPLTVPSSTATAYTKSFLVFPGQNKIDFILTYTLGENTYELNETLDTGNNQWVEATNYIYNITITPLEIKFAPTETPWTQDTNTSFNL